jgi:hypothetical protein
MISQTKRAALTNKCTSVMGHFDGHDNGPIQCWAHRPIQQVYGYSRCHWTPPLGKYLHRIAPAATMVIDFGSKNWVVALWYGYAVSEASNQKAWNGPSTQLIEATSCVELSNAMLKAEELSYFSSYQTLPTDKDWWSYQPAEKLVKKLFVMTVNSC